MGNILLHNPKGQRVGISFTDVQNPKTRTTVKEIITRKRTPLPVGILSSSEMLQIKNKYDTHPTHTRH